MRTLAIVLGVMLCAVPALAKDKPKPSAAPEQEQAPAPVADDQLDVDPKLLDVTMDPDQRLEFETRNFRVLTNAIGRRDAAEELATSLEGAYYTIDQVLRLPMRKEAGVVRAYFFRKESEYRRFGGPARGAYARAGVLIFYQGGSSTEELLEVMTHEATHAFVDQFIVDPKVVLPVWLNEGFAEYVGTSLIRNGKIEPGVFYARQRFEFHGGSTVARSHPAWVARWLAHEVEAGRAPGLSSLLATGRKEFYGGKQADLFYASAWAFVHYLRHGVPEGPTKFSKLLKAIANGGETEAAFRAAYGVPPGELDGPFAKYVVGTLSHPPEPPDDHLKKVKN